LFSQCTLVHIGKMTPTALLGAGA